MGWHQQYTTASKSVYFPNIEKGSEDMDALQAAHTWIIDNHIYALGTHNLSTSAAEDILPPFLQASTLW